MSSARPDAANAFAFPTASHPEEGEKVRTQARTQPGEDQLDDAIAESFPASDPVSVTVSPVPKEPPAGAAGAAHARRLPGSTAVWAAALLSTAALGVGAAMLLGRRRAAQKKPLSLLSQGLRGVWSEAGSQVNKALPKAQKLGRGQVKHLKRTLQGVRP